MTVHGIALIPLLKYLAICYPERDPKKVIFADDLTSGGRLSKLCSWWKDLLISIFSKTKQGSISKPEYGSKPAEIFDNKRNHLDRGPIGAVIGS